MTRFADPAVYQCPACEKFFLRQRLASINFSCTRAWSDGAPTAWWAQEPLVRCHACTALFWIDDLEPVGELPRKPSDVDGLYRLLARWRGDTRGWLRAEQTWLEIPREWKAAKSVGSVDFDDVAYVLSESDGLSRSRLLWLRRTIWWTLNDRYRVRSDGSAIPNVPTMDKVQERANMQVILELLEQGEMGPRDLAEKGELLRLLGRFDEAVTVLKAVPSDGYNEVRASKIERLARCGDLQVRPLDAKAGCVW